MTETRRYYRFLLPIIFAQAHRIFQRQVTFLDAFVIVPSHVSRFAVLPLSRAPLDSVTEAVTGPRWSYTSACVSLCDQTPKPSIPWRHVSQPGSQWSLLPPPPPFLPSHEINEVQEYAEQEIRCPYVRLRLADGGNMATYTNTVERRRYPPFGGEEEEQLDWMRGVVRD